MQNVTITGVIGEIKFDGSGDMLSDLNVYQYQSREVSGNKLYSAVRIGTTREINDSKGDLLNTDLFVWANFKRNDSDDTERNPSAQTMKTPLQSVCSRQCRANEYAVRLEIACCWRCVQCRENEV
jgi:hypothetical protein